MSGKHYIIATSDGYIGHPPIEFHSKEAAAKELAAIVRHEAQVCRSRYERCSVAGSARKGSVQIKIGGRQGYHLWQRYVINERPGARKPPRSAPQEKKTSAQLDAEIAETLAERNPSHATKKKPKAPLRIAYRLQLTPSELKAMEFARGRYAWPDMLSAHATEGGLVAFTESEMWQWTDDVDSDDAPFPLASPAFAAKLQRFYGERV